MDLARGACLLSVPGMKIDASSNVFMENLHSSRNLETRYYITANGQASDYHWARESKLMIKVGIYESYLLPEYEDVDHQSDNEYMLQSPNTNGDKVKFKDIMNKYCRHPIPDHYSISLEISRDRATKAYEIICDSTDPNRPTCPPEYRDGDKYVVRTQNQPCKKMGTFPVTLQPGRNEIICTEKSHLLTDIFNLTYRRDQPIKFPESDCRAAKARCEQCWTHQCKPRRRDAKDDQCCKIECYTLGDCKKFTSEHCSSTQVECAMGDAFTYVIQPVYQNIQNEFQCHIKRKQPQILYKLFYYIEIKDRLKTPRVDVVVNSSDLAYQSKGTFQAQYITVEHNSGLNLKDEFVLLGKAAKGPKKYNYQVRTLKKPSEFSKKKVTIHPITQNTYAASMQFSKPFAYSTSSWTKGKNNCHKDISVMHQVEKLYKEDPQPVSVNLKVDPQDKSNEKPYKYIFRASENPPEFRLSVKGNVSVLSWYFKDGPTLHVDDSLKASLESTWDRKIWKIHFAGWMSGCPGWFHVVISDRTTLEELFNYDMLIFCPAQFNLTFFVPNWGRGIDRTFDIKLTDGKKSHDFYLTNMVFEPDPVKKKPPVVKEFVADPIYEQLPIHVVLPGIPGFLLFMGIISICLVCTRKKRSVYKVNSTNNGNGTRLCCAPNTSLNSCQCGIVVVYAVFRLLYSLIFTFTVIGALITHMTQSDFKKLEGISKFQAVHINKSRELAKKISLHGQQELLRQTKLTLGMQGSCSVYMDDLYDLISRQMKNVTTNPRLRKTKSLTTYIKQRFQHKMDKFQEEIDAFKESYKKQFDSVIKPPLSTYERYLEDVYDNEWLDVPRGMFNWSVYASRRPSIFRDNPYLSGKVVDFASFIEVEEAERAQLIPHQMWQRFHGSMPKLPSLKTEDPYKVLDNCLSEQQDLNSGGTPVHKLDSVRYYSQELPGKTEIGPKFEYHNASVEFKFMVKEEAPKYGGLLFSMQEFVSTLNLNMFKYLFMALDVLLLVCRCTRTYMNIQKLCNGFEETEALDDGKYQSQAHGLQHYDESDMMQVGGRPDVTHTCAGGTSVGQDENLLDLTGVPSSESQRRMLADSFGTGKSYSVEKNSYSKIQPARKSKPSRASKFIYSVITHSLVPKIVITLLLFYMYYICITNLYSFINMDVISYYGGYSTFISDLDLRINQTNEYLSQQAAHLNNVSMAIFKRQMDSELLGMKSTLDYFNWQQDHIAQSFREEACIFRAELLSNRSCDVQVQALRLDIPVLPCNFVPIKAQLYAGLQKEAFVQQVKQDMAPLVAALQAFLIKSSYAVLFVLSVMFIIHVAGAVVFLFLRTRLIFPTHRIFITSTPPALIENHRAANCEASHLVRTEGNTLQPATTSNNNMADTQSNDSVDFAFSETKV